MYQLSDSQDITEGVDSIKQTIDKITRILPDVDEDIEKQVDEFFSTIKLETEELKEEEIE